MPLRRRASAVAGMALALLAGLLAPLPHAASAAPADPLSRSSRTCTGTGITHTIAEVQGTGAATPLSGAVKVTGVVTADLRTGGLNGVYIQTAGTGGPHRRVAAGRASNGIFVFFGTDPSKFPTVALGDGVEVTGTVAEFNGLTRITTDTRAATAVCRSGLTVKPTPLRFPLAAAARESLESMVVSPAGTATVSDVFDTARYGEVTLAGGSDEPARVVTDVAVPGSPEAADLKAENAGRRIVLDDGRSTNLSSAGLLPPYLSAAEPLRVGDQVRSWGPTVLSYGFGQWRLQPTTPVDDATPAADRTTFDATNSRPAAPAGVGGDIQVGSFNVSNYFVHFGGAARGADDAAGLHKQQAKIVSAIGDLDADVLALEEIENSIRFDGGARPQAALQTLVAALNEVEGDGTWDYVRRPAELPGPSGEDVITTAIIFKPASVTPLGAPRSINDEAVWSNAREPIAQTFTSGDATFTVVANHFKSKSPGSPTGDNVDTGDGQGAWNGDRRRQAASLLSFGKALQADSASPDVLLLGDFNAYTREDPVQDLAAGGYTDVGSEHPTGHHSYVFAGEEGSLDHALASPSMLARITGFDIWEINAHESIAFQYDGHPAFYDAGPYRASDHNPELVGIDTSDEAPAPVELQLLGVNDFHGRIEPTATTPAVVGGAAQLGGLVDQLRAANPHTGFVSAGDNIGASTFVSAVDDDNPTLDALDAAGLDVSAVGNHELDKGFDDLRRRVVDRADFPYLGANVYFEDGSGRALQPFSVQDLGGIAVGYIGVVTEQTPSLVNPGGVAALAFRDPVAEADAVAAQLSDGDPANGEADVIVLLAHEGAAASTTSAADLQDDPVFGAFTRVSDHIDAIFSGHTHQEYALAVPAPGGGTRPIVQTGDYGEKLARVTLTVDPASTDVTASTAALLDVRDIEPVNAEVARIVADAEANAAVLGAEVIGSVTADIERDPERATESVAANFIADVQLEATRDPGRGGARIALMNPGGVRADLRYAPDGKVTYAEAFAVQPFANDVITKTYTGAQLQAALEQQWQPAGAARPVLWLGVSEGFTYAYDPRARQGQRIVASSMELDGVPVDPAATYRVTVNSFLAAGGDNFTALAGGTDPSTTGDNDLTMLVDHLRAHSPVTADTARRTRPGRRPCWIDGEHGGRRAPVTELPGLLACARPLIRGLGRTG